MKPDDLDELLAPAIPESDGRGTWWLGLLGVTVLLVALAFVVLRSRAVTDVEPVAAPVATTSAVQSPSTSATSEAARSLELVPYVGEPALLYHPTVLPADWELCRQVEDISKGDLFCGDDDAVWVEISVRDSAQVRLAGTPIPELTNAVWLTDRDVEALAVPSGRFHVVLVEAEGIPESDLLVIARSVPLVADRDALYAEYELPLDLGGIPAGELADLLALYDPDPRVTNRREGEAQVHTPTVSLSVFYGDGPTVPDFAATLPFPRLAEADRPIVIGESTSRNRSYAIWDQRGHSWRLEGQLSPEEITSLALSTVDAVAALETQ